MALEKKIFNEEKSGIKLEIARMLAGDKSTVQALYNEQYPYIKQYVLFNKGTEEEAKDIFQEAITVAYLKLKESPVLSSGLGTFITGIAKKMWLNHLRKYKKERSSLGYESLMILDDQNIEEMLQSHQLKTVYYRHFEKLNEVCKQILGLFFKKESMELITKKAGLSSVGYTKKKKFQCKKHLIESIQNDPLYAELKESYKRVAL